MIDQLLLKGYWYTHQNNYTKQSQCPKVTSHSLWTSWLLLKSHGVLPKKSHLPYVSTTSHTLHSPSPTNLVRPVTGVALTLLGNNCNINKVAETKRETVIHSMLTVLPVLPNSPPLTLLTPLEVISKSLTTRLQVVLLLLPVLKAMVVINSTVMLAVELF